MNINPLEIGGFVSIFSYSFFASLHCAFMCGPLVCAVLGPQAHFSNRQLWFYNIFRMVGYSTIGFFIAYLMSALVSEFRFLGNILSWTIGGALCVAGLATMCYRPFAHKFNLSLKIFPSTPKQIVRALSRSSPSVRSASLGLVTALIPCMTLAPAYAMAAGSGNSMKGALFMFGFGLGTIPMMLFAPALTRGALDRFPKRMGTIASGLFLLLAGVITIWRVFHTH
jgi:hypothetical protein